MEEKKGLDSILEELEETKSNIPAELQKRQYGESYDYQARVNQAETRNCLKSIFISSMSIL